MTKSLRVFHFAIIVLFAVVVSGCSSEPDTTDQQVQGQSETTSANDGNPEVWLIGNWVNDEAATRDNWGDEADDMSRKMVDELGMKIQFNEDMTVIITRNERSNEGLWNIQSSTEDSVNIQWYGKEEGARRLDIEISFYEKDRFIFKSAEVNREDRLIFVRESE